MGGVRILVGTRKGAFVLTSDAARQRWEVAGPHFGGWEVYHVAGSPADPDRLYASQSSGWFGQVVQRSTDGGRPGPAACRGRVRPVDDHPEHPALRFPPELHVENLEPVAAGHALGDGPDAVALGLL